jgi:hypothetical protein
MFLFDKTDSPKKIISKGQKIKILILKLTKPNILKRYARPIKIKTAPIKTC